MSYLRPYQETIRDAVLAELGNGTKSTLYVQPTGTGKTQVALDIIDQWPDQDCDILCLAHRQELIYQPWHRWEQKTGQYANMIMADQKREQTMNRSRINFASKDSLHPNRLRNEFPDPRRVGLIWVDEAHHAVKSAKSYSHILEYFSDANPDLRIVGCTATPDRKDEEALGQVFDSVAHEYPLLDPHGGPSAIDDGWLVPIEQEIVTVEELSFEGVGRRGGDFIDSQLQKMLLENKAVEKIVAATKQIAQTQKCLCFTTGIEQAILSAAILNAEWDGCARAIASRVPADLEYDFVVKSGDRQARQQMLKAWARNDFPYLMNCAVLTEGFDEPGIMVISMGRPTQSRALYAQCLGRGTRVLPGVIEGQKDDGSWWRLETAEERKAAIAASAKPRILVLDFVGNSQHSLISSADVLGGRFPDEIVEAAKERVAAGQKDVQEALLDAEAAEIRRKEEEAQRQREIERRRAVKAVARVERKKVDPFTVLNVAVTREPAYHRGRRPTPRMVEALQKFKVEDQEIAKMSFQKASDLLDTLVSRIQQKKCTYRQAKILDQMGYSGDCSFEEAHRRLDYLIPRMKNNQHIPTINAALNEIDQCRNLDAINRAAQRFAEHRMAFTDNEWEVLKDHGKRVKQDLLERSTGEATSI
jgi:superfamily II DNA or RNA helicase